MSSDIVKRLREYAEAEASGRYGWICSRDPKNLIFWTAADRIEALEGENAALKKTNGEWLAKEAREIYATLCKALEDKQ